MSNLNISPTKADYFAIKIAKDGIFRTAEEVLTQKNVNMCKIRSIWPEIPNYGKEIDEQAEINAHYRGYLKKQKADILAFKRDENLIIPEMINYDELWGGEGLGRKSDPKSTISSRTSSKSDHV